MSKEIKIENYSIGLRHPPFIVAEMSGNHNQSLDKALKIVEAAAKAGAHAIKLQTYTADTLTIDAKDGAFSIQDKKSLWNGETLYSLYQKAYTPWEWHKPIFEHAQKLGLVAFSSPFDETAVDFLETLNVPAYKIASFENNHLPLIRKAASTGKPLIISTGMATIQEIQEAMDAAHQAGGKDIILLKCTSTYPASPKDSNLATISDLKERFKVEVGLSDHTMGVGVATAAVAMGAVFIEKHFTLSRQEGGVDAAFSMEPQELKALVEETKNAWEAIGQVTYGPTDSEKDSIRFRRSIYVVKDIQKGEAFNAQNLRIIRPGDGLHPRHYDSLLTKKACCDIKKGTPMTLALAS
jgi:pseudaminic acid synthase